MNTVDTNHLGLASIFAPRKVEVKEVKQEDVKDSLEHAFFIDLNDCARNNDRTNNVKINNKNKGSKAAKFLILGCTL